MSGAKLYQKLKELGFEEYLKSQGISAVSVSQNPQSIDWIFAFPKINDFLQWVMNTMDQTQFVSFQEIEAYENIDVRIDYESIREMIDLLDDTPYKPDPMHSLQPSILDELQQQKHAQNQEIARLQAELKSIEEIDINSLMSSLQSKFNETLRGLFDSLDIFLKEFNSNSNVLPISMVQEYTTADEQLSRLIIQYSKQVEEVIQAIDFSVHHHCLMSDRAEEYTELCAEKIKLQGISLKNLEQGIKASAVKQKYETALQTLEDIVLREQKDKFLQDDTINSKLNSIKEELKTLEQQNSTLISEELSEIIKELAKLQAEENLLESHNELSDKRYEYESIKLQEIMKLLDEQKKKHLLAMAGILLEQERVQSEYDCLFEVKTFLEDMKAQVDFRIDYYQKFRNKHELEIGERMTIDQRDPILNELYQIIEGNHQDTNLTYDKLIELINAIFERHQKNNEIYHRNIDKILESADISLEISEKVLGNLNVIKNTRNIDGGTNYLALSMQIEEQEQKLNKILLEVEQTRVNSKRSPSGLTERNLFVDFLTTPQGETPKYLKDCEDII